MTRIAIYCDILLIEVKNKKILLRAYVCRCVYADVSVNVFICVYVSLRHHFHNLNYTRYSRGFAFIVRLCNTFTDVISVYLSLSLQHPPSLSSVYKIKLNININNAYIYTYIWAHVCMWACVVNCFLLSLSFSLLTNEWNTKIYN